MHPLLIPSYLLAIAVEVLFPLLLALWLRRRLRVSWKYFGYGALVFGIFQLLTRVPAMLIGQYLLAGALNSSRFLMVGWVVLAALTAGLFEEGGRYLGYRFLWKKGEDRTWPQALMYGAGHGGLESMLLVGGLALIGLLNIVIVSRIDAAALPPDQALAIFQAQETISLTPWWAPLLAALERFLVMVVQISLAVLVLQVFARRQAGWWWLALGYHALADLVPGLAQVYLVPRLPQWGGLLLLEGLVGIFALCSAGIIYGLRPRLAAPPGGAGEPFAGEAATPV